MTFKAVNKQDRTGVCVCTYVCVSVSSSAPLCQLLYTVSMFYVILDLQWLVFHEIIELSDIKKYVALDSRGQLHC